MSRDTDVLYPACDSELAVHPDYIPKLRALVAASTRRLVVAFSTKLALEEAVLESLAGLHEDLRARAGGFLRVAVSFSSLSKLDEIEPGTASFASRTEVLSRAHALGIPVSVTLKPLLPFVPLSDYAAIVAATIPYAGHFLLGDLFVQPESAFARRHIVGRHVISKRTIEWLDERPVWHVVDQSERRAQLTATIERLGGVAHDSDLEVIRAIDRAWVPQGALQAQQA